MRQISMDFLSILSFEYQFRRIQHHNYYNLNKLYNNLTKIKKRGSMINATLPSGNYSRGLKKIKTTQGITEINNNVLIKIN